MVVSLFETGYLATGAGLFEYDRGPPVARGHGGPARRRDAPGRAVRRGTARRPGSPAPRLVRRRGPPGRRRAGRARHRAQVGARDRVGLGDARGNPAASRRISTSAVARRPRPRAASTSRTAPGRSSDTAPRELAWRAMSDTPHPIDERLEQLAKLKEEARTPGNEASVRRQHERGKLTARERLELLLDPGSFVELDMLARHRAHGFGIENNRPLTDGVVTGWGTVDGRKIFVFSQDFTIFGGALGEVYAEKIHKVMDLAESTGAPLVGLNDGGGARIQEGVVSLASYGGIFHRNVQGVGCDPADLGRARTVRGRRGLLARDDRLHLHGEGRLEHVHHRPRRREDGHRRRGHARGARRRADARDEVGRRHVRRRRRAALHRAGALPVVVPAVEQPRGPAALRGDRRPRAFVRRAASSSSPRRRTARTT